MNLIKKLAPKITYFATLFTLFIAMGFIGLYLAVGPGLPDVESIRKIQLQTPMSIYSADQQLISEIGDIRRIPITLDQVPKDFINALLSTEDQRFYEHSGVDIRGVLRALIKLAVTQTKSEGASTITMQVARNYYLNREKRFSRKFTEMFLAWKIESELNKNEILELFLNKIHFSHRAYGLGAAAQVYYGTTLDKLTIAQLATLAGIPQGESVNNPISNPTRSKARRAHVLGRMFAENHISQAQYEQALAEPIETKKHGASTLVDAPFVAEMVRQYVIEKYGRDAINDGLRVYTSLDSALQTYANHALVEGLEEYDRRHGFRGAEQTFAVTPETTNQQILDWLKPIPSVADLEPVIVTAVTEETATFMFKNGVPGTFDLASVKWARRYVDENHRGPVVKTVDQVVQVGDLVRVRRDTQFLGSSESSEESKENETTEALATSQTQAESSQPEADQSDPVFTYRLAQIPEVSGGIVALDPKNGAVVALVGGYSYTLNKFNMVTQARRQPGSNIKPFIYSAAFNKGYTPASMINDMPIVEADITAENFWRPKNDGDNYLGPTSLRTALRRSKNTVSVRLMRAIGPGYAKQYLEQVGFPSEHMPPFLSLALGSAAFTPFEVVAGYAVLANGGYQVAPWFIERIEDSNGQIVFETQPLTVCHECEAVLASQLADVDETLKQGNMATIEDNEAEERFLDSTSSPVAPNKPAPGQTQTDTLVINPLEQSLPRFENQPATPTPLEYMAPRVMEVRNHYLVDNILKDVIHRGTATPTLTRTKSRLLKRNDLAGKTGTTNDAKDAWFSGYNTELVATTWVGFSDHAKKLGVREFGGIAALPVWQKFMEEALEETRQKNHPRPDGIVAVRIDPENGLLATTLTKNPSFELFRTENAPTEYAEKPVENILHDNDDILEDDTIF